MVVVPHLLPPSTRNRVPVRMLCAHLVNVLLHIYHVFLRSVALFCVGEVEHTHPPTARLLLLALLPPQRLRGATLARRGAHTLTLPLPYPYATLALPLRYPDPTITPPLRYF